MANIVVKCCRSIKHLPTRIICVLLLALQAASLDYYLATYKSVYWATWAGADFIIIIVYIATFIFAYLYHKENKFWTEENKDSEAALHTKLAVFTWMLYAIILSVKVCFAFSDFADTLDENDFFGPNTLKSSIALAGMVYLLLLTTLHDAKPGTERKKYIDELTGTVIFDILDGVDSMEPLFDKEAVDDFPPGLRDAIIGIACVNFVIPAIPMITLAKTNFGHSKLAQNLVIIHKLFLAFLVNLPLLITRMIVWHGASHGVSIFTLKNIIVIAVISYDLYEHLESEGEGKETGRGRPSTGKSRSDNGSTTEDYALEARFNYA